MRRRQGKDKELTRSQEGGKEERDEGLKSAMYTPSNSLMSGISAQAAQTKRQSRSR